MHWGVGQHTGGILVVKDTQNYEYYALITDTLNISMLQYNIYKQTSIPTQSTSKDPKIPKPQP